jgi:glucose-6-phosphate isomerase
MDSAGSGYRFVRAQAHAELARLAARPFDLTAPGALTSDRLRALRASGAGYDLLYGTQRVDEAALAALRALAREADAAGQFRRLMAGEVMNRIEGHESENRPVQHFASRNAFDDLPDPFDIGAARPAVALAREQLERLRVFLAELDSGGAANAQREPFTDLVHIGIGGSDLGPRALYLALQPWRQGGRRVHFISNVDPDDAAQALRGLDLSRTLVNVVSKSGSTLETLTNETLARRAFTEAGLKPERHFLCVTGRGSPMDNPARYRATFHMFDSIGGRYSATSMVGGVCLGFGLGFAAFQELLRGAREMDLASLAPEPSANLPLLAALLGIWNRDFLGLPTLAVLPYSQALVRFAAHLQQLDMESNGKAVTKQGEAAEFDTGPVVWGEPGTNGQHAFYQLIHQSRTVVPCEFIGFRESQFGNDVTVQGTTSQQKLLANLFAQVIALATGKNDANPNRRFPGNRPSLLLMGQRLTPRALGALLAFYENKVAYQGLIWNINSFDQEGVQLGKVLATRILGQFQRANAGGKPPGKPPAGAQDDPLGRALLEAARVV